MLNTRQICGRFAVSSGGVTLLWPEREGVGPEAVLNGGSSFGQLRRESLGKWESKSPPTEPP